MIMAAITLMSLPVFPAEASTQAVKTDQILLGLVLVTGAILVVVFGLILGFSFRYRNGSPAKRGTLPNWITRDFEVGWTAATLFLALFIAWWTTSSSLGSLAPTKGALQIHVLAKQWMWKTQHPNGAREINALHVPVGEPVTLLMTSEDTIHSFFVPQFRIKQDVLPGRITQTWFTATVPGEFHLFCTQLCGTEHARMVGTVTAMTPEDYARWTRRAAAGRRHRARRGGAVPVARLLGLPRRLARRPRAAARGHLRAAGTPRRRAHRDGG